MPDERSSDRSDWEGGAYAAEADEFVMDDGSTVIQVPATHSLQNVGQSDYKELLIEFK